MADQFVLTADVVTDRNIPILTMSRADRPYSARVVVLHGLRSSKERYLRELYLLSRLGLTASAIDLPLHGDRQDAVTLEAELCNDYVGCIRRIVYSAADDIKALIGHWGESSPIGLYGVSLGGLAAHLLAVSEQRISAIAAIITSPDWTTADPNLQALDGSRLFETLANESPVNSPTAYPPKALLMLVGDEDNVLTSAGSILLYEQLTPLYSTLGISDRLSLKVYPETGHTYTAEMSDRASLWLHTHLITR